METKTKTTTIIHSGARCNVVLFFLDAMQIHTADWFSPMSEKEMFEKFSVDSERRDATKLKHNVRPTTMKNAQWEAVQVNNYQTTLQLDRKYPEFFESIEDYIKKFIKTVPEVYPYNTQEARGAIDKIHREHSDILTTTLYADVHLDKQRKESMETVKKKIISADKRIFDKMDRFASNKQLFVILWDFFNSDNSYRTTKWTEQQNKTSEYDAWKKWTELIAEILYNRSWYTDIDVVLAQWNHDENKLMYMRDLLHYYFQNDDRITIKESQTNGRYYYAWGDNLLWFTHGHLAKPSDLPMLMNKEQKNAKHKEWWTGHRHKDITQSFHWMQVNTVWAVSSGGDRNDKYWVDHINNQLFGVLYHKKDWKVAQFYEKI